MTVFGPWKDCQRCDRCRLRWGVFAPAPRKRPAILVLAAAASRASQFVEQPDPLLARVRERLSVLGNLPIQEVHANVLVACGPTSTPRADEAAACAQRLHDQATLKKWQLKLVVLLGDETLRLARNAGLYRAGLFLLNGQQVSAVTIRTSKRSVTIQHCHRPGRTLCGGPPGSAAHLPANANV